MKKSNTKRTAIMMSVMALFLTFVLAAGVTFSWSEGGDKGYIDGSNLVISTGSSLTMRQDGLSANSIILSKSSLEEVSSADGRNFFFPMTDNTTNITKDMTFREGTAADENTKYISLDFELIAGGNATPVYLGAGTIIQCDDANVMKALRMSFNLNDGSDPIVFKPTQMPGITDSYSPVTTISAVGEPTQGSTDTKAYGDYYYKGVGQDSTHLFYLKGGETKNITLSIWLEGTLFESDTVADQNIDIYIDFTTTVDDLVKYNFVDNTHGYNDGGLETWVSNTDELSGTTYDTMMYIFDVDTNRYYAMEATDEVDSDGNTLRWTAYVPDTIENFYFRRYSIDIDQWWNEWEPAMGDEILTDPNDEHTYVAICGNTKDWKVENYGCYGYWKDQYGTFRIYFEMQAPFSDLHCYAWDTNGDACASTGEWPGSGMEKVKNTDNGTLYYIDLKETENIDGIQFNNGGETRIYLEGFNYSTTTSAYVYYYDEYGTKYEPLGTWHNDKGVAQYDSSNTVGKYWVDFTPEYLLAHQDKKFYVIANNKNSSQYPTSGDGPDGKIGRVYRFTNGNMTLEKLAGPYNIKDEIFDEYIYNGAVFWYKSDSDNGFYVYTDSDYSLIYPNKPAE